MSETAALGSSLRLRIGEGGSRLFSGLTSYLPTSADDDNDGQQMNGMDTGLTILYHTCGPECRQDSMLDSRPSIAIPIDMVALSMKVEAEDLRGNPQFREPTYLSRPDIPS